MKKKDVIRHFGSQADVAYAMTAAGYRISRPAVSQWLAEVPLLRTYQLEWITSGALKAEKPRIQ